MKRWIKGKVKPALGNFGRKNLAGVYKVYEKLFWYIVEKKKKKGLRKKGYQYLEQIDKVLTKNGIKYFATYGTLLGIIREGCFMDYDDDIDLGILNTDKFSWELLENSMKEIGMLKKHQFVLGSRITEQTYKSGYLNVDFFLYEMEGDKSVSYVYFHKKNEKYPQDHFSTAVNVTSLIADVKRMKISMGEVAVPEHPELFLKEIYGEDWRIPKKGWEKERDIVLEELGHVEKANY